jgi:hypothetical protein
MPGRPLAVTELVIVTTAAGDRDSGALTKAEAEAAETEDLMPMGSRYAGCNL